MISKPCYLKIVKQRPRSNDRIFFCFVSKELLCSTLYALFYRHILVQRSRIREQVWPRRSGEEKTLLITINVISRRPPFFLSPLVTNSFPLSTDRIMHKYGLPLRHKSLSFIYPPDRWILSILIYRKLCLKKIDSNFHFNFLLLTIHSIC